MTDTVHGKRQRIPSSKLASADNVGEFELNSHRDVCQHAGGVSAVNPATASSSRTPISTCLGSVTLKEEDDPEASGLSDSSKRPPRKKKHTTWKAPATRVPSPADSNDDTALSGADMPAQKTPPAASSESESEVEEEVKPKVSRTLDVDQFFGPMEKKGPMGAQKRVRKCLICKSSDTYLCPEVTTLRRHIQANHKPKYKRWCDRNKFESKLPNDVKAQKAKAAIKNKIQSTLDDKLEPLPERVPPYTDARFAEAAEDWLIATDQPLDTLSHPKFHTMINLAARASNSVKIPEKRATRQSILGRFWQRVRDLRKVLMSDKVQGTISLMCDAWQASNRDAYFAVTGHWIEEVSPGKWALQGQLLGFTEMNTAHNGKRLGHALYKIVRRYGIAHKIGWVTCDNVSNNLTMLQDFQARLNTDPDRQKLKEWDYKSHHIRCLAHIINLAMQAFIAAYSKTPHHDPASATSLDDQISTSTSTTSNGKPARDEISLVRCLAVKTRSSAKCNTLLKDLQKKDDVANPQTLVVDMKVWWSSTFMMLQRAHDLRKYLNRFLLEISSEESNAEKQCKLLELRVTDEEWQCIAELLNLLKHADKAQQAFSSENEPCLSNRLPALEKLHKAWLSCATKDKYNNFKTALLAGHTKIEEYYNKTALADAYMMTMILDPTIKTRYFQQHWGEDLELDVKKEAEKIFKERWEELNKPTNQTRSTARTLSVSKSWLDDDSDDEGLPSTSSAPPSDKPWLKEFNRYIDGEDELDDGQTVVSWWGINALRHPTWASLAQDYLAIMASSVSSERAFSSAGITISK